MNHFLSLFCFCLVLLPLSGFSINESDENSVALVRSGGRSLLSLPQGVTRIGAALDGKVSLLDSSDRIIWTFATGGPIYSSYQNQDNASEPTYRFFLDIGDDWGLYAHGYLVQRPHKLPVTIEEFIKGAPYISEEGVTLGSKKTAVFVVEASTGRLIRTYSSSPDSHSTVQSEVNEELLKSGSTTNAELQHKETHHLFITRTDYTLHSFSSNSKKLLWNMTVSEIGYAFLCQDLENPFITATMDSYELGPDIGNDFEMPFACQSKGVIQRFRELGNSEFSVRVHYDDAMLPLPASNPMSSSQPNVDRILDNRGKAKMLRAPASEPVSLLQPEDDKLSRYYDIDESEAATGFPPLKTKISGEVVAYIVRMAVNGVLSIFFKQSTVLFLILCGVIVVSCIIYRHALVAEGKLLLKGHLGILNSTTATLKRKKTRKLGNSTGSTEKYDKHVSSENDDKYAFMDLNKLADSGFDGRRIGKLFVSNTEIARGSNGTIVLEGIYEGRPVAVKRLVRAHHDMAFKEIQNLIASDRHPNIVRWYGVENDQDFVYLSLERCTCSLDDLIHIYSNSFHNTIFSEDQSSRAVIEYKRRLDSAKGMMQDLNLWKANGHPSPLLLKLMRDMVSGLVHLHELGIIHRDLKPQNVLILKERSLCAKLSDMGFSRRLLGDMSSLGHLATGCGSSGWQAPEQLLHGRQTRAVDLFSLGCVLFFCITGGKHPFGDRLERDVNIVNSRMDLYLVHGIPEAEDIISRLLNPDPQLRPSAVEVLHHPLFWNSEIRLSFFRDTSDRVELEDRQSASKLLKALESIASVALGTRWNEKLEPAFIANIGHYRRYRFDSVRDLLRVMRNKLNHYRELPKEIQELVGPVPEGFDDYFASRFPRLLIEVYKVVYRYCRAEETFQKYFKSDVV